MSGKASEVTINNFPYISLNSPRRILVGIRPFRKGGIRLEKDMIGSKTIIHNYGHGGAGVSLAPATAQQAANLTEQCFNGNKCQKKVTVLGCGIIGLMTALQCAKKGYKVDIVAERIPKKIEKEDQVNKMCTSEVAPGYWLPYHYQFADQKQHAERSERSYRKYLEMKNKSKSIRQVEVYEDMDMEQIKRHAPEFISHTCKTVTLKIGLRTFKMTNFQTLQIHLQNLLQQLLLQCEKHKIKLTEQQIKKQDLTKFSSPILINCLALGSKQIFNDDKIYGVKGHLMQIANKTKLQGIFGFKDQKDKPVKLYCFDEKILIGLTKEENQSLRVNTVVVRELEERVSKFCDSLGLQVQAKL